RPTLQGMARTVDFIRLHPTASPEDIEEARLRPREVESKLTRLLSGLASAATLGILLGALGWLSARGYHVLIPLAAGPTVFAIVCALLIGAPIVASLLPEARRTLVMLVASVAIYPLILGGWALPVLLYPLLLCALARRRIRLRFKIATALLLWAAPLVARV